MGPDFPESAFKYSFLDDSYDRLHRSEEKTGVLMTSFSCLAIFVACLGLTLTPFLHIKGERRSAYAKYVVRLPVRLFPFYHGILSSWCLLVVIIVPVAWYAVDEWLANFAYQVDVNPVIFLISALVVATLAFVTVGYHAYKASLSNPAQVLREA